MTAQILMNVRKILGIVILMLLVPTPSATSSVNVMVGLWETEQVAQVSSMKLKWHLWVLSSWSNTGKENLGKRCRKYILIHMQTLLLRLLNWPILKRKVRLLPFFLLRSLSVLPPYSPHLYSSLPHLVWFLGFLAEVRTVISLLFWTSYVKIFVICTVYMKYSFLVHSLSFCFVLFCFIDSICISRF